MQASKLSPNERKSELPTVVDAQKYQTAKKMFLDLTGNNVAYNAKTVKDICQRSEYSIKIGGGLAILGNEYLLTTENQAAVIAAGANAVMVARALKTLTNEGVVLSNEIYFTLIREAISGGNNMKEILELLIKLNSINVLTFINTEGRLSSLNVDQLRGLQESVLDLIKDCHDKKQTKINFTETLIIYLIKLRDNKIELTKKIKEILISFISSSGIFFSPPISIEIKSGIADALISLKQSNIDLTDIIINTIRDTFESNRQEVVSALQSLKKNEVELTEEVVNLIYQPHSSFYRDNTLKKDIVETLITLKKNKVNITPALLLSLSFTFNCSSVEHIVVAFILLENHKIALTPNIIKGIQHLHKDTIGSFVKVWIFLRNKGITLTDEIITLSTELSFNFTRSHLAGGRSYEIDTLNSDIEKFVDTIIFLQSLQYSIQNIRELLINKGMSLATLYIIVNELQRLQFHNFSLDIKFVSALMLVSSEAIPEVVASLIQLNSLNLEFINDKFLIDFVRDCRYAPKEVSEAIATVCHANFLQNKHTIDFILKFPSKAFNIVIGCILLEKIEISLTNVNIFLASDEINASAIINYINAQNQLVIQCLDAMMDHFSLSKELMHIIQSYLSPLDNIIEELPYSELTSKEELTLDNKSVVQARKMIVETAEFQLPNLDKAAEARKAITTVSACEPDSQQGELKKQPESKHLPSRFSEEKISLHVVRRYLYFYHDPYNNIRIMLGDELPPAETNHSTNISSASCSSNTP